MPSKTKKKAEKATPYGAVVATEAAVSDDAEVAAQVKRVHDVYPNLSKENCHKALISCGFDVARAITELAESTAALDEWSSTSTKKTKGKNKGKKDEQQQQQDQKQKEEEERAKAREAEVQKQKEKKLAQKQRAEQRQKAKEDRVHQQEETKQAAAKAKAQEPTVLEQEVKTLKAAGVQVAESGMRKLTVDQIMNPQAALPTAVPSTSFYQPPASISTTLFAMPQPPGLTIQRSSLPGMREASISLQQLEQTMNSKWSEAQMQVLQETQRLHAAVTAREQKIKLEVERMYAREAHLIAQRKAWLEDLSARLANASEAELQQAQQPLETFNAFQQADLPTWDVDRFTADTSSIVRSIETFGQVHHVPFGQPAEPPKVSTAGAKSLAPGQGRPRRQQNAVGTAPAPAQPQQQSQQQQPQQQRQPQQQQPQKQQQPQQQQPHPQAGANGVAGGTADGLPKRDKPKRNRNRKPRANAQ